MLDWHGAAWCRSVADSRPAIIPVGSSDIQTAFKRNQHTGITEFPLYCEGVDRTRFAYAIYLLNKVTHITDLSVCLSHQLSEVLSCGALVPQCSNSPESVISSMNERCL